MHCCKSYKRIPVVHCSLFILFFPFAKMSVRRVPEAVG